MMNSNNCCYFFSRFQVPAPALWLTCCINYSANLIHKTLVICISSYNIITINARTTRQHWLKQGFARIWLPLAPPFPSESGHNDGGIQLQKPPHPFLKWRHEQSHRSAVSSDISHALPLVAKRITFPFQKNKTFNSFNKRLYAWASTHCWVNTENNPKSH